MPTYKKYELKPKKDAKGNLKKPEVRWLVKGYLGEDPKTGIPKYTTLRGYLKQADAKNAFDDALYKFKHSERHDSHKFTIDEAYNKWIKTHASEIRPTTMREYKSAYNNNIKPHLGGYFVGAITPMDVQEWINSLTVTGRTPKGVLTMIMDYAVIMGWVQVNPCLAAKLPRGKRTYAVTKDKRYTLKEAQHFIAVLNSKASKCPETWERRRVLLTLVLATGMRRGEVVGLKWCDVDFNRSLLHIKRAIQDTADGEVVGDTKTETSSRTIVLSPDVTKMLAQWCVTQARDLLAEGREISSNQWLFTGQAADGHLSLSTPWEWMKALADKSDLRQISLHGLRHTKATLLAQAEVDVTSIAAILGHSSIDTTTRIYIHPTHEGQSEAEEVYSKLFK
ncbi:tyrosine-type recombinase/integrase [Lacticaseibacillus baoqingensis]|uniref:Tyrosine-type recombinase/integrase n=1 Tax=Lacticaseibacillus baoqingensis TaxID=2486013 RepID=A0ABW4E907_9LACO|nr:site-specific integrase [Lacticaseibacillus baoqingensis]